MKDTIYYKQSELLLKILPLLNKEKCFALKGGTALNFFVRDLPRLSVDIDLTYIHVNERTKSLTDITQGMLNILTNVGILIPGAVVQKKILANTDFLKGLNVIVDGVMIKIEPNLVIRGSVFPNTQMQLSKEAEQIFEMTCSVNTLSLADLYGGKICAALDRQHPRDFFDVKILLENEGITDDIRKAFVVYLICNNRPMSELLQPNEIDFKNIFDFQFRGMTLKDISCADLEKTREMLINTINAELTENERRFLLSIKELHPDFELLGIEDIEKLPAVGWKLRNLEKMPKKKRLESVGKLKRVLNL